MFLHFGDKCDRRVRGPKWEFGGGVNTENVKYKVEENKSSSARRILGNSE